MNYSPFFNYELLKKLSKKLNFSINFKNPTDKYGYILFDNNFRHYISQGSLLLNSHSAFSIAKDKRFTNQFLSKAGFSVPAFEYLFKTNLEGSKNYEENILKINNFMENNSFPLYIKPSSGLGGDLVFRINSINEIILKMNKIFKKYPTAILQESVVGDEYRFIIYKKTVIAVYRKNPIIIYADGIHTKKYFLKNIPYHEEVDLILDLKNIPKKGTLIFESDKLNSQYRKGITDVTDEIHISINDYVINHAQEIGMTLSGIDIVINNPICDPLNKEKTWCLEINAQPGLRNYYNLSSSAAERIINLYKTILEDIELGKLY